MPAFYPAILVRYLVIYQGLNCDSVEIVGVPIGGVVDGTWFQLFRVCCEARRAEEKREEGGGEVGAHCNLGRTMYQSVQGYHRHLNQLLVIYLLLWMKMVGYHRI